MEKLLSLIAICTLSFFMMAQPAPLLANAEEESMYFTLSEEADKAIASGDYVMAVERLNEAIGIDPDNPANVLLLSNLGIVHGYLDQDSLAMEAFDSAIRIAPSMTIVLVNRGKLHLKMENDRAAFADFGRVIEMDSTNVDALFYHGFIALYDGALQVAEHDFSLLKETDPDAHNTSIALATLYSMTGFDEKAIPYFQRLIEDEPQPEYYAGLAGCFLATDRLSDASALLTEAIGKFPDDPELYMYRAWLNKKRYLKKETQKDMQKAISLGADPRKVHRLLQD